MNRREFLASFMAGGIVLGTAGHTLLDTRSSNDLLTMDASLQTLERLKNTNITTLGEWNIYQILIHSAQSIEFSMSGFPEHKSAFFKNTIGKLVFAAFSANGKMTHSLSAVIPGAPLIRVSSDIDYAYERLKRSMINFKEYNGQLAEHFAYGSLTKQEYEKAHAMHFYNHLLEVELVS